MSQSPFVTSLKHLAAEFVGTFMIVFCGCGAVMAAERFPGSFTPAWISVVFGAVVTLMVYLLGPVSGAHLNPAVTIAFAVGRHFPVKRVGLYVVAQFSGAIAASAALHALLPAGLSYGATVPTVSLAAAFLWETALTFSLMFIVLAIATDSRVTVALPATLIGVVVGLEAFIAGPITGASMNPARSLAPALFQGQLGVLWIYLAAPVVGASSASWLYDRIRATAHKTPELT